MKILWEFPGCTFLILNCTSSFSDSAQGLPSPGSSISLHLSGWLRCPWHVTTLHSKFPFLCLSTPGDSDLLAPSTQRVVRGPAAPALSINILEILNLGLHGDLLKHNLNFKETPR